MPASSVGHGEPSSLGKSLEVGSYGPSEYLVKEVKIFMDTDDWNPVKHQREVEHP